MTYVDPTNFAPREQIAERVLDSDREGFEPMFEVRRIWVPFKDDFDEFAAVVAHTIRTRLIYRTDNGRLARGLVRYTGDLQKIWLRNMRRQGSRKLQNLVMRVTFIRRKTERPGGRWVIGIRFEEILADFEGQRVEASPEVSKHANKAKTNAFLSIAMVATEDMGCKGDQIRSLLEYAIKIGYPDNQKLWYYSHRAVFEFVHNMTDEERAKMPNAVPQHSRAFGVPLMAYPFTGNLYSPRLGYGLDWQIFPFTKYRYLGQSSEATVQQELYEIYDDVHAASDVVVKAFGISQASVYPSKYVAEFGKEHLAKLLKGKDTKFRETESVHHFFEPKCR